MSAFAKVTWKNMACPSWSGGYTWITTRWIFFPQLRGTSNHRGIGLLSKSQLGFRLQSLSLFTVTFEHACILDPNHRAHYIIVYRPPPSQVNHFTIPAFMEEFEDFLSEVTVLPGKLVIMGDFNFHMDKLHKSEVHRFRTILASFGLEQHINTAIEIHGHILDLVITSTEENLVRFCDVGLWYGSNHNMLTCVLQQVKPPPVKVTCTMRDFQNLDPTPFKNDLTDKLASIPSARMLIPRGWNKVVPSTFAWDSRYLKNLPVVLCNYQ